MKYLIALFLLLSMTLASVNTHAGGIRGGGFRSSSFSSRPSFGGGFRSGTSSGYRSFSSSPSRTYTFGRSAAAPRTVYSAPSRSSYRSSSKTTVNNHYHGSGSSSGGGLGLTDYIILNSMMDHGHDRGVVYANTPSAGTGGPVQVESESTVVYQEHEGHGWRNFFFCILGVGALYGLYRLIRALEPS